MMKKSPRQEISIENAHQRYPHRNERVGIGGWAVAKLPSYQYNYDNYDCTNKIWLCSKIKKHLRGSTQAPIRPLAIILTADLLALANIKAYINSTVTESHSEPFFHVYLAVISYSTLRITKIRFY